MSEIITFPLPDGANYVIPDVGDENWGQNVTDFLVAIPAGVLPRSGTFTLTGDVSFGPTFGLVSNYFKSFTLSPASAGFIRLSKTDAIEWRNNANSADLPLAINGSDQLTFNGTPLISTTGNLTDTGTDGIVVTGGTGALISSASLAQHVADASHNGYLAAADWSTFNGKQAALTFGNLTDAGTDGIVVTNGTGAVIGSGTSIAQHVADTTHSGYLSSTDWNTFNGKGAGTVSSVALTVPTFLSVSGSPITSSGTLAISLSGTAIPVANGGTGVTSLGNLTDAGTDGITITSGTGAVIHNTSISQHVADSTHNGYLSSTDWSTFNSAAGGGITSLTGDVTGTGPGATATTLATVNGNVGSFVNANITVNAKGLITAASSGTASGTVNVGTAGNFSYYATSAAAVSDSGISITAPTFSGRITGNTIGLTAMTNQFSFTNAGGGNQIRTMSVTGTTTIGEVITFPDIGVSTTVAYLEGAQTFTGTKTFSGGAGAITMSGSTIAMGSNKITGLANGTAAADAVAFSQILGFRILQVVSASTSTTTTSTSTTYADATNLTVTITPTLATSTVWIITSVACKAVQAAATQTVVGLRIVRGASTVVNTYEAAAGLGGGGAVADSGFSQVLLFTPDSPATTSATAYKVQLNSGNATATASVNDGAYPTKSYIYAIEVG